MNKRWIVIILGICLIISHALYSQIEIDSITISLLLICSFFLFLPEIIKLYPYINKLKAAGTEIELNHNVEKIKEKLPEVAKNLTGTISKNPYKENFQETSDVIQKQLDEVFKLGIDLGRKNYRDKGRGEISNVKLIKNTGGTVNLHYDEVY